MTSSGWQLRDPTVSARGAKSCALVNAKFEKINLTLGSKSDPVKTPFGATTFGDENATRRTLEFTLAHDDAVEFWKQFDQWAVNYLAEHSPRLLKKKHSVDQILALYKSPMQQKGDYRPILRCKVNVSGNNAVCCWDEQNPAVPLEPASLGVPMVHRGAARSQEARPLPSPSPDLRPTAWTPSL